MKVDANGSRTFRGAPRGVASVLYCLDRAGEVCEHSFRVNIQRNVFLTAGQLPTRTASPTALGGASSAGPTSTPLATQGPSTALIVKIRNNTGWYFQVYIDGNFVLTVSPAKYVTYKLSQAGKHVFQFCLDTDRCWKEREIVVNGETEIFIAP